MILHWADSYHNWNVTKASEKHLSSFAKICSSIRQILRTRSVPEIHLESIWDIQEPPFVEPGLVIQPRKDKEQQIQLVNETIHENDFDIIICTDGSTIKKNSKYLGQTGSAAVIYDRSLQSTENVVSCEVGSMSHNYIGELVAIKLALSHLIDRQLKNKSIFLLTDCTAAMEMSFTNALPKAYAKQIRANRKLILAVRESGNLINKYHLIWISLEMKLLIVKPKKQLLELSLAARTITSTYSSSTKGESHAKLTIPCWFWPSNQ